MAMEHKTNRKILERIKGGFRARMIAGIAVIVPLVVTFLVLRTVFEWVDGLSAPLVRRILGHHIPGLGVLITLLIVWGVGAAAMNVLGRRLIAIGSSLLSRLPLVRSVYGPTAQLMETVVSPEQMGFKRVALVEYPSSGIWTVAFVTGEVSRGNDKPPAYTVFLPTTPNPMTGWLAVLPPERVKMTDLAVEEAFRLVVSGGIVTPPSFRADI